MKIEKERYVAFLRGINVGGHHKVPMADLRKAMATIKFEKVVTLLNSGNVVFDAVVDHPAVLEETISRHLEKVFGFPIPTIVRKSNTIYQMIACDPFKDVVVTKDIRLYVSFLRKDTETALQLPWTSDDHSYKILGKSDKTVFSMLDLSQAKTPKAMEIFEKTYGTDTTTRNWNTILRIEKQLKSHP